MERMRLASISTVWRLMTRMPAPKCSRIFRDSVTSEIWGMFSIRQTPSTSRAAGMMATAAFFCAADFDLSKQGLSTLYNILSQSLTLSLKEQILLYRLASRDRPMVVRTVYPRGQKTYPRGNKRSDSGRPAAPAGAGIAGRNEQRRETSAVVSSVTELELCLEYQSSSTTSMTLIPAWCIVTNTGEYYVNCSTGTVTFGGIL